MVMQTFTFVENKSRKAAALFKRLTDKVHGRQGPNGGHVPKFSGNTYDATHMIALAIKKAASSEGPKMRPPSKASATTTDGEELQQSVLGQQSRGAQSPGLPDDDLERHEELERTT